MCYYVTKEGICVQAGWRCPYVETDFEDCDCPCFEQR